MFKTGNGKMGRHHHVGGTGVRGRDTDFPSAHINVSEPAQALPLDMNTIRQFSFGTLDRSTVHERPSTSGGPAKTSDLAFRREAWKRETRDDLDFFPRPAHGIQTTYYDFPLPGGLPTPDDSPKEAQPSRKASLPRSPTPDSIVEQTMNGREMEIGMALGSPTQAPIAWQPQNYGHTYSPSPDPTVASILPPPPKQKASKWKVFGGLFGGKKTTPQAQNFYQLQAEGRPSDAENIARDPPTRGWTVSGPSSDKKKPDVKRANTAPNRANLRQTQDDNPEILIDGSRIDDNHAQQGANNGNLMLDVDIPSVEMERYSVMFGSLLGKPGSSTPSLLARRQATLDRLKVVNEELAIKEQEIQEKERQIRQPRRATSPQPTRSPAFSLFPNTPSRESRLGRTPSPNGRLVRSNTSPAALSPSRPSFAPGPDNEIHATLMEPGPHIPNNYESEVSPHARSSSLAPKALTINKQPDLRTVVKMAQAQAAETQLSSRSFTQGQSQLSLSPESDIYTSSPPPLKSSHPHPLSSSAIPRSGQMIKVATSISGSATSYSDHSTSASASSISTSDSALPFPQPPAITQKVARDSSPSPGHVNKSLPIPMSKFTAPPQTHKTRGRSATLAAPTTNNSPAQSQIPIPTRNVGPIISGPTNLSATHLPPTPPTQARKSEEEKEGDEDEEARLKSLADVSIARQISVSRQQRQLLIPIKGSFKGKSVAINNSQSPQNATLSSTPSRPAMRKRASTVSASPSGGRIYDHNFPSPGMSAGIPVAHVTSPLSAVEKAANNHIISPANGSQNRSQSQNRKEKDKGREHLVQGVKPSTPTLVIVNGNGSTQDREREWEGAIVTKKKSSEGLGIAERRRKARAERDGRGLGGGKGHEYKKSEKVVVERV